MRGANTPLLHPTRHHLTGTNRNYVRRASRQSQTAIVYAVRLVIPRYERKPTTSTHSSTPMAKYHDIRHSFQAKRTSNYLMQGIF